MRAEMNREQRGGRLRVEQRTNGHRDDSAVQQEMGMEDEYYC